jgi:hypothetical protein
MKSYPYEIPSSQLDSVVWQPKMAGIPSGGCGDDVDCGRQSLRLQTENPHSRQLFRHLIATALLAVITVVFWLSLIGLAPSAYATVQRALIQPSSQPRRRPRHNTKVKGRQ